MTKNKVAVLFMGHHVFCKLQLVLLALTKSNNTYGKHRIKGWEWQSLT